MRRIAAIAWLVLAAAALARAGEGDAAAMQEILILRVDNIDAIDAVDSSLVVFLSSMKSDAAYIAPLRTLVGPQLRNPFLSGLVADAWLEGLLLAPVRPGPLEWVWIFPVENRDDYLADLERQGMSNAEGMDDVSVLTDTDGAGKVAVYYLEWLPGNIAIFGRDRSAVRAAWDIYETASAGHGLLAAARGRELSPDAMLRMTPFRFASWQDKDSGVYWWRTQVMRLASELVEFWGPEPARARLMTSLAEDLAALPSAWNGCELDLWFMEDAVEWRFLLVGASARPGPLSQLSAMRRLPAGAAQAYALAIDGNTFADLEGFVGRLLLGAAGGVTPPAARDVASSFSRMLSQAGAMQAAVAWLPAPFDSPTFGSTRLMLVEWARPELLDAAWLVFEAGIASEGPVAAFFAQLGWHAVLELPEAAPGSGRLVIRPVGRGAGNREPPYYDAGFAIRRLGKWLALAWGACGAAGQDLDATLRYRAAMAEAALMGGEPAGSPDTRRAFILMGPDGASFLMTLNPVRFLQMLSAEAADWRSLAPDEPEPLSVHLAKEMYEYRDIGGAWSLAGERKDGFWDVNGRISWDSLRAFGAALGVSETIGPVDAGKAEDDLAPMDWETGLGQP